MSIGTWRDLLECCTLPTGRALGCCCLSSECVDDGPIGTREETLEALGRCARLVFGIGSIEDEDWGKFDPPLNGDGWSVVDSVCEFAGSESHVQAGCYVNSQHKGVGIVAYRGTCSFRGGLQGLSLWCPLLAGPSIRFAVRQASSFYQKCQAMHPDKKIYVTGHSLGGYLAEAVASYHGVDGAGFNCPGPWTLHPCRKMTGHHRPQFEVHLTRDDPLAATLFPKPENSHHINSPIWHEGNQHRLCPPYVIPIGDIQNVYSSITEFDSETMVNQIDELMDMYPPDSDISEVDSDDLSMLDWESRERLELRKPLM